MEKITQEILSTYRNAMNELSNDEHYMFLYSDKNNESNIAKKNKKQWFKIKGLKVPCQKEPSTNTKQQNALIKRSGATQLIKNVATYPSNIFDGAK